MSDITHIRGDSKRITGTFYESDGETPITLTGGKVYFTMGTSNNPADDLDALIQKTITNFAGLDPGVVRVDLVPDDTDSLKPGVYYYDMEHISSAGVITSKPRCRYTIVSDITRSKT